MGWPWPVGERIFDEVDLRSTLPFAAAGWCGEGYSSNCEELFQVVWVVYLPACMDMHIASIMAGRVVMFVVTCPTHASLSSLIQYVLLNIAI